MKKAIITVLVVGLCLSAVFASDNTVKASVVPYGFQISTSTASGQDPVKSRYGIGAQISYQRKLFSGLYAEVGLAWDTFFMSGERPVFSNLLAFAGVGYEYALTEKLSGDLHVNVGTDTLFYKSKVSETFTIKGGLDLNYAVSEKLSISVGCEGVFGFSKKAETNYVNYRVIPTLGVCYEF